MKSFEQRVRALSERLRVSELRALEAWALSWLDEATPAPGSPVDAQVHVPEDNRKLQPENQTEPAW